MSKDITLSDFIGMSKAWSNKDGSYSVEITLINMVKSILIVDNCNSEYDAKERVYLYLLNILQNKMRLKNAKSEGEI